MFWGGYFFILYYFNESQALTCLFIWFGISSILTSTELSTIFLYLKALVLRLKCMSQSPGELVKFWFSRSGGGPEHLHVC